MKKLLITLTCITQLSLGASSEQVEQYLSVSHAEEQLIDMQTQFSQLQNRISQESNGTSYDLQMLTLRFRDYIERNLSVDEMDEILDNYKNVALMHFVNASDEAQNYDYNTTSLYFQNVKATEDSQKRIDLIKEISQKFYPKEALIAMFDGLMKPLIKNGIGGKDVTDKMIKTAKEKYATTMLKQAELEILFACREFSIDELEELLKIAQTSATDHESKVTFGAMAYALKDFFLSMASRYDVKKHQQHKKTDTQTSK